MTDELSAYGPGSYISEFVSGGPKNYAFRIYTPSTGKTKEVVKVRGFTLSYVNAKKLNFLRMKKILLSFLRTGISDKITLVFTEIRRQNDDVVTRCTKKDYRVVYDKRRVLRDGSTLPYGF